MALPDKMFYPIISSREATARNASQESAYGRIHAIVAILFSFDLSQVVTILVLNAPLFLISQC